MAAVAAVAEWALAALGLWGASPGVKLYQQVASLNLQIADMKQEATVREQQLDLAVRQRDNCRDQVNDIRRLCDREMQ